MYRRYRPQSFQEVIGQDHVVAPLKAALAAGRTTHAYLFSGPRGCGKTTSARILARCLNCVKYPTDTPCGECESCRDLARDGAGSLDVVELDAASHGGVDDARDLREQAGFAPVRDRFKIFIIDEAHMVSNQGFNALLKLVEEPPEHVKFIFATTEPDKVIGTIRSRTHHYPFRLVPPDELEKYLARLCAQEGVSASKEVLSLVIRAGTGSVRDTLSVLDQIIGGSDSHTLDYERAVALLGYTSAHLLDDAVSAVAQRDGAALFGVVDSVVKSGHDPRRFVEDLLQRLRDVVIIALTGDAARDVFVSVPDDQYQRMAQQAQQLGAARASRCADITNEALNMMVGATAPRLQLELLCARLVVAQAEVAPSATATAKVPEGGQVSAPPPELAKWKKPSAQQAAAAKQDVRVSPPAPTQSPAPAPVPAPTPAPAPTSVPAEAATPPAPPAPDKLPQSAAAQARVVSAGPSLEILEKVTKAWDQVLAHEKLGGLVRNQLKSGAHIVDVVDGTLRIAFDMPAVALRFTQRRSGMHVAEVIKELLGIELEVVAVPAAESPHPKDDAAEVSGEPVTPPSAAELAPVQIEAEEPELEEPEEEIPCVEETCAVEEQADPAGVLGSLVDGTEVFRGDDHIQQPHKNEATPEPEEPAVPAITTSADVPFYAQDMPAIPPREYPRGAQPIASKQSETNAPASAPAKDRPVWEVHPPVKETEPVLDESSEVSEDDPTISESPLVGLKVLVDAFDGRIVEEIDDSKGNE